MTKDFHMHPQVVLAPDRFDAFAAQAIARGIDEVCITDHMPLSTSRAGDRIPAGRVSDYCRTVRKIAEKYAGTLSVKLGIEIDYHPDFTDEIESVLRAGDFDFVLGSSHMHVGQCDIFRLVSTRNEYAEAALQNTLLAAQSGYFHAISHLDMYRWIFTLPKRFPLQDDGYALEKHWPAIERVLHAISENGLWMEINPHLAIIQGSLNGMYPERDIVARALEMDIRCCYGSDAHTAEHVGEMLCELRQHPVYGKALKEWEEEA